MSLGPFARCVGGWLWVLHLCLSLTPSVVSAAEAKPSPSMESVELTGRVVCLAEEMHQAFDAELPSQHAHLYGFKTSNGEYYTLLRTKMSEALFLDERLRQKQLVIKGRVFPGSKLVEVTGNLHSLKNGKLCELYYYCDICVIKTISPEPCLCCQGPVELKEIPVDAP